MSFTATIIHVRLWHLELSHPPILPISPPNLGCLDKTLRGAADQTDNVLAKTAPGLNQFRFSICVTVQEQGSQRP